MKRKYEALWSAVLCQAIDDYITDFHGVDKNGVRHFGKKHYWDDWFASRDFTHVCQLADIEQVSARDAFTRSETAPNEMRAIVKGTPLAREVVLS